MQAIQKSRLLQFGEQAMSMARRAVALLLKVLETAVHTSPAHRPTLSQGTEEYDVPDAS